MLKAKQLLVLIPRHFTLLAVSRDAPRGIMNKFGRLHSQAWNKASSHENAEVEKAIC